MVCSHHVTSSKLHASLDVVHVRRHSIRRPWRKTALLPTRALRQSTPSTHELLTAMLRWPYRGTLRKTISEELDRTQRGLKALDKQAKRKCADDIETVRRTAAPLSEYSNVWTFPVCLVAYSTMVMAWASELAGSQYPAPVCGAVGFLLGSSFALAHRAATVRLWVSPRAPLNVVVTGGTRGIGKALVREFLAAGDNVYLAARSAKGVRETIAEVADTCTRQRQLAGVECDVSKPSSVARLASLAQDHFEDRTIDVWINNAGQSGSFKPFLEASADDLQSVTQTNLRGALLCTRAAIRAMAASPLRGNRRGHVFNMDGAGADGLPTANYAAYGATKAGIAHIMASLTAECNAADLNIGVHTLSPGMVLTELLLDGATEQNKKVFNVLCEHPETAAAYLVPRVRSVVARQSSMAYIRVLTTFTALGKFLTAPLRVGRFFDPDGSINYAEDAAERLSGRTAKRTARALSSRRRRSAELQVSYAACLCVCVLALSAQPGQLNFDMPAAMLASLRH